MRRLSVIIPNYNYERFVAEAIESALALDWTDVEIVVVDDGSTDGSLEVIRRYEDRVQVLATENATQRVAVNRGFAACTGDVVIVLDSDDVLPPDLPWHLAQVWGPEVAKAQFRMQRVDVNGHPLEARFTRREVVPSASQVRTWFTRTSAYPTPPGSGNAYARWFLELVLPVDEAVGDAADSALVAAAPLLGEVVTVPEVVVRYRQHSSNDSNLLHDVTRFSREVDRARRRWEFAARVAPTQHLDPRAVFHSRETLQLRVAALVVTPNIAHALPGDGRVRMLRDALTAPFYPGPETPRTRALVSMWCLATLAAPSRLARTLVDVRYRQRAAQVTTPEQAAPPVPWAAGSRRLSVVIVNHNYAQFVTTAIRSALAVQWDDLEVIVVDDGSTDGSPELIAGFGEAVTAVLLPKVGHIAATNAGWRRASGDVVIFLDADDFLPADMASETFAVWTPAVSKVQFRMQRVDAMGRRLGPVFPPYDPTATPDQIRSWFLRTSAYPTPPGSANAYSAHFLERVFPIPEDFGHSPDSACLAAAPLHGDVVTAERVVVGYRRHRLNLSNVLEGSHMFPRQVRRARERWIFAFASVGQVADESVLRRSRELLQFRAAAFRLAPHEVGLPGESLPRLLADIVRSPVHPGPESPYQRLTVVVWSLAVLWAPTARSTHWLLHCRYKY